MRKIFVLLLLFLFILGLSVVSAQDIEGIIRQNINLIGKQVPAGYAPGPFAGQYIKQRSDDVTLTAWVYPGTLIVTAFSIGIHGASRSKMEAVLIRLGFIRTGNTYESKSRVATIIELDDYVQCHILETF